MPTRRVSCHGSAIINSSDNTFNIEIGKEGATIKATDTKALTGSVIFPLNTLPDDVSHLTSVMLDFSSQQARVCELVLLSGGDELFPKREVWKRSSFTIKLKDPSIEAEQGWKGLALWIAVEFDSRAGSLEFQSVGLEVTVPSPKPVDRVKFDTGTWKVTDVRAWNDPRLRTESRINFSAEFSSAPKVMVSMTGGDVDSKTNFRANVYATSVDSRGFTVHADTWGDTTLYSCNVSWIAIEV